MKEVKLNRETHEIGPNDIPEVKLEYEELFLSDTLDSRPYELFIVSREGIRMRLDVRSQRKIGAAFDIEQFHRIDCEFGMMAQFDQLLAGLNRCLQRDPKETDMADLEALDGQCKLVELDEAVKNFASPELLKGDN